jgi:membrane protease YdiL (CAAX protease family)
MSDTDSRLQEAPARARPAQTRVQRRLADGLYSLIQPDRIPDQPRRLPPIRVEVVITLLGLLGWVVFLRCYDQVSPVAAVDLRYDRAAIARIAEDYVRSRGLDVQGYRRATSFGPDREAQIYLERAVGVRRMNQLVRAKEVPVWTWTVRWFVPEQTEEVYVNVLPTGEVVGFDHILPEDAPGAAVTPAEAQQIAERFLQAEQGIALGDWTLYDVSATTRPQRTDHSLIWVKQGLDLGEGDLRIWVAVQGDRVGRFGTWVRVPEAFSRDFTQERSRAWLLDDIATGLSMLFLAGGVLVVLWGLYVGLKIGWAPVLAGAAAGLVDLLDSLNRLSLLGSGYDTAVDWQTYVLNTLANYLVSAAESAFLVAFLVVAAQWLLRAVWPRQDKLIPAPPRRGATFARSAWRGMMVGGLELAYLILFYTLAKGLGAWSPVRTPDVDLLATPLPFLAAVYIGLLPALTEELIFRGLGIGLMMRLTRGRTLLALLVPSVLWGFAHSSYLTDPIWLRGVELTISSLLLSGLFFLLFDLTTTIVAHYTYNAALIAIVLIRSGSPAFVITGLSALLLGLAPGLIVLLRRLLGRRPEEPGAVSIAAGGDEDWAQVPGWLAPPAEAGPSRQHLVCLRSASGELLGLAHGLVAGDGPENRYGLVVDIRVLEPYRSRYYGTALYKSLLEWFRAQGVDQVQAQVPMGNAGAATFWTVQGFRPFARLWWRGLAARR